ncbi:MAG: ATP phosphoribosyltransferase regulatory subunit [Pseudomonadota bacterium]
MHNWLLPENIEDILPAEAQRVERLRRAILDAFAAHGYQLVMPPLLEYVESLLTGSGHDLDLKTFKLVDQLSGRMLGLRADITPQVARIDAHLLNRAGVTRLCYCGSVLHTLPSGLRRTREPLQIGAELYGHAGIESDLEVQRLMLEALGLAGVPGVRLDLGHVMVFRSLIRHADVAAELEAELFRALQTKDQTALRDLVRPLDARTQGALLALPQLYGDVAVLGEAARALPDYPEIRHALGQLSTIADAMGRAVVQCSFDLGEVRGYHYHSGVVFAAYAPGWSNAIALGGRYDEIGKAFGRARPATGFSIDLREVAALLPAPALRPGILAPYGDDAAQREKISALRAQGETVIVELPGHAGSRADYGCDRELVQKNGKWEVVNLA